MKYDVVVIGAGPVGSFIAGNLAENNYKVLLIEKKHDVGRHICAGVIGCEAFRKFSLPKGSIIKEAKKISLFSPSQKKLAYSSDTPLAFIVDRVKMDKLIFRESLEKGVNFINCCEVKQIKELSNCVEVICENKIKGNISKYQAQIVVIASGYGPKLLKAVNLPLYEKVVVGVQALFKVRELEEVEVYLGQSISPGGFGWIVPVSDETARVGLVALKHPLLYFKRFMDLLGKRLEKMLSRIETALIPSFPLKRTYKNRIIVVGEAAGHIKTTTYGGIYYGLIGAECALNTIEKAFETGKFSEEVLSNYEKEWHKLLWEEINWGDRLRNWYISARDETLDNLFDMLGDNGLFSKIKSSIKFDWHSDIIKLALRYKFINLKN